MLGDLRVLDPASELLLDTERAALQALFDIVRHGLLGFDAELAQAHAAARAAVADRARSRASSRRCRTCRHAEHANAAATIGGRDVVLVAHRRGRRPASATPSATEAVRAALLAAGAVAVDEADAEVVRVESGRPRYGVDLDDSVIPQEAGLNERAVSFTKGCYVGQETVARLFYKGKPNRHLRGLRLSGAAAAGRRAARSATARSAR